MVGGIGGVVEEEEEEPEEEEQEKVDKEEEELLRMVELLVKSVRARVGISPAIFCVVDPLFRA